MSISGHPDCQLAHFRTSRTHTVGNSTIDDECMYYWKMLYIFFKALVVLSSKLCMTILLAYFHDNFSFPQKQNNFGCHATSLI